MAKAIHVHVTVNTPRGEYDHGYETDSLDEVMRDVLAHQPSCTSVVMSIVPNNGTAFQLPKSD